MDKAKPVMQEVNSLLDLDGRKRKPKTIYKKDQPSIMSTVYMADDIRRSDFQLEFGTNKVSIFRGLSKQSWFFEDHLKGAGKSAMVLDL